MVTSALVLGLFPHVSKCVRCPPPVTPVGTQALIKAQKLAKKRMKEGGNGAGGVKKLGGDNDNVDDADKALPSALVSRQARNAHADTRIVV